MRGLPDGVLRRVQRRDALRRRRVQPRVEALGFFLPKSFEYVRCGDCMVAKQELEKEEAKKNEEAKAMKEKEAKAMKEKEAKAMKEKEAKAKKEKEAKAMKEKEAKAKKEKEAKAKKKSTPTKSTPSKASGGREYAGIGGKENPRVVREEAQAMSTCTGRGTKTSANVRDGPRRAGIQRR